MTGSRYLAQRAIAYQSLGAIVYHRVVAEPPRKCRTIMGVWILNDNENDRTVLYDSTTERPFGPGFYEPDEAENFVRYVAAIGLSRNLHGGAPNATLDDAHDRWCRLTKCSECFESIDYAYLNELIDEDDEDFMERMEEHVATGEASLEAVPNWSCAKCQARNAAKAAR